MGTPATIIKIERTNSNRIKNLKVMHCNYDGYFEGAGKNLVKSFVDETDINDLFDFCGNYVSQICETKKETFENTKLENGNGSYDFKNFNEFKNKLGLNSTYFYFWDQGVWHCARYEDIYYERTLKLQKMTRLNAPKPVAVIEPIPAPKKAKTVNNNSDWKVW